MTPPASQSIYPSLLLPANHENSTAHGLDVQSLLQRLRDEICYQLERNQRYYDVRYGESQANYAASITDDYNGEGEEVARLTLLLHRIDSELERHSIST
jgi:hypothetical protein